MSNRSKPNATDTFVPWLAPKVDAKPEFKQGLDAKLAAGDFAMETLNQSSSQGDSEGFTLWKPRSLDDEIALAAGANSLASESIIEDVAPEVQPDPLEYTQKQLQEYGDNQFQLGVAQARESEAAALTESRHRLEALIGTLREQRVDSSNFYEPLKELLFKSLRAILHIPLVESRAAVEATLALLLKEIDKDCDGKPAGVRLFLNPADLMLLKDTDFVIRTDIELAADESLSRGSMRAMMQDSIIEDLTEARIEQVVDSLLRPIDRCDGSIVTDQQPSIHELSEDATTVPEMTLEPQAALIQGIELDQQIEMEQPLEGEDTEEEIILDKQSDEHDQ